MLFFDIGANRGDAVIAGLNRGYKVIALEPAPKVYKDLVANFIYNDNVVPIKMAVSDTDGNEIEFYECVEDGLSTTEKSWLVDSSMPYSGKDYRTIKAITITIDTLVKIYGQPNLIKIDVEGAEWSVFNGMTKYYGPLTFEWTKETIHEHNKQLDYLYKLGYRKYSPQFIEHHLQEPITWYPLSPNSYETLALNNWIEDNQEAWEKENWKVSGLRPTADVGMCWVK